MSLYANILQIKKVLGHIDTWLDKATAFAQAKKFDPNTLLTARIAPDMLPLKFQLQTVCDQAKFAAARTSGKTPPSTPDTEQTIPELKARIASTLAYLGEFTAKDFEGTDTRLVTTPRWEGKHLTATNYLLQHCQPNFYFHAAMIYALLRHNGVELGKRDFLGELTWAPS